MEALYDALRLTVIGMGVVFAALFGLSLLMFALPLLSGQKAANKRSSVQPAAPAVVESSASVAETAAATDRGGLSPETVAVIATALAAYLGQTPENLNIISIQRAPASLGSWASAARRESIQY